MLLGLFGGIGLFLLGMALLTDGLKAVAGSALRHVLTRFTGGPFSALLSGTALTALVQSSSATTLTAIGFVSAGLLSFPRAVAVIFGANLGTTSTGWLVSLLGLEFDVGTMALPIIGVGALLNVFARARIRGVGLALAGFGLLFLGIDVLQQGMATMAEQMSLDLLPGDTVLGRLALVAIGGAMAAVMQSSSAAFMTTLAALHEGAISMTQGAALVVGQNLGTTLTAGLAVIGGSAAAKRTALAHFAFNVVAAAVALALLPVFLHVVLWASAAMDEDPGAVGLTIFHSVFNVVGVLLLFPLLDRFSGLVARLVPDHSPALTRYLDTSVGRVRAVAVEAARRTVAEITRVVLATCLQRLGHAPTGRTDEDLAAADQAMAQTRGFLSRVHVDVVDGIEERRHLSTLHAMDHLHRLIAACREPSFSFGDAHEYVPQMEHRLSETLGRAEAWLAGKQKVPPDIGSVSRWLAQERRQGRLAILQAIAHGQLDTNTALDQLEAMHWLDRVGYHAWRAIVHLQDPPPELTPDAGLASEAHRDAPPPLGSV